MPKIQVSTEVPVSKAKAWQQYTDPDSIIRWNFASDDWHCPSATTELTVGGKHLARMETRDGKTGFNFVGHYSEVDPPNAVTLVLDDGRKSRTIFEESENGTRVTTLFDADDGAPFETQKEGWQAILDNYRDYVANEPE